jgi:3-methyladenine DNA glycosylase AlkD
MPRKVAEVGGGTGRLNAALLADEIHRRIRKLPHQSTEPVRQIRKEYSRRLRPAAPRDVLAIASALRDRQRWVAYELLHFHPGGLAVLGLEDVESLGQGLDGWVAVDTFARYISGPAWQQGRIPDEAIQRWAASPDRYWRRAALVSTVPLNLRAAGGTGDTRRTLDICQRLVADHDDTIVKALSWALRELAIWDPEAVRGFLAAHDGDLAARVKREVRNKLATGLKNPRGGRPSRLA